MKKSDNVNAKANNIAFLLAADSEERCCENFEKGKEAYKKYQGGVLK
jgi:hypothetical protein